jgi:hypothetical protein
MRKKKPDSDEEEGAAEAPAQTIDIRFARELTTLPVYYSNQASVRTSPHDVQIIFGQAMEATPQMVTTNPQVMVYLSMVHAKRLAAILTNQVSFYEANFGKLPEA